MSLASHSQLTRPSQFLVLSNALLVNLSSSAFCPFAFLLVTTIFQDSKSNLEMSRMIYFALFSCIQCLFASAQTCYFPDSSIVEAYTPCNGTSGISHCCRRGDACLTTGLCYMTGDMSINTGACTDSTRTDPSCFQQCPRCESQFRHRL